MTRHDIAIADIPTIDHRIVELQDAIRRNEQDGGMELELEYLRMAKSMHIAETDHAAR